MKFVPKIEDFPGFKEGDLAKLVDLGTRQRGLVVVTGHTGTGKTTIATALAMRWVEASGGKLALCQYPTEHLHDGFKVGEGEVIHCTRELTAMSPHDGRRLDYAMLDDQDALSSRRILRYFDISSRMPAILVINNPLLSMLLGLKSSNGMSYVDVDHNVGLFRVELAKVADLILTTSTSRIKHGGSNRHVVTFDVQSFNEWLPAFKADLTYS